MLSFFSVLLLRCIKEKFMRRLYGVVVRTRVSGMVCLGLNSNLISSLTGRLWISSPTFPDLSFHMPGMRRAIESSSFNHLI